MSPRTPRTGTPALPAPPAGAPSPRAARAGATPSPAPGEALLAAQGEARRGLRAGPQALGDARTAYLGAQWSGEHDRRPEPGLLVRARL